MYSIFKGGFAVKKIAYNLILPFTFAAVLLWSIIGVSQDRSFFAQQYGQNNTAQVTGIQQQDLMSITDGLLKYMLGSRENLDMQFEINGEMREIFDQREKLHMVDVHILYKNVILIAAGISLICCAAAVYLAKCDSVKKVKQILRKKYIPSLIGFAVFMGALGVIIAVNFQWFWTVFHEIIFTNDLWLLDPNYSIMINMFPLEFFFNMCLQIIIVSVLWCFVVRLVLIDFNSLPKWLKSRRKFKDQM